MCLLMLSSFFVISAERIAPQYTFIMEVAWKNSTTLHPVKYDTIYTGHNDLNNVQLRGCFKYFMSIWVNFLMPCQAFLWLFVTVTRFFTYTSYFINSYASSWDRWIDIVTTFKLTFEYVYSDKHTIHNFTYNNNVFWLDIICYCAHKRWECNRSNWK